MKSNVGHLVYSVDLKNLPFYKELFSFLGWSIWYDDPTMLGVGSEAGVSLWFGAATKDLKNDYDAPGLNHLGINVEEQAQVDETVAYLRQRGVPALFETPRHRPEFSNDPAQTYYQVMFESPDRVLFEVLYTGPFAK